MTTNGNHNGNGNGNGSSWRREWGLETLGLGVAEIASMVVSVGTFTFLGEWAPEITDTVSNVVGKKLEPYLDTIESGLQKVCTLKECQPDFTKPREERAKHYGKYLTLFSISVPLGIVTELGVRVLMNKALKVKTPPADGLKKFLQKYTPKLTHGILPTWHDLAIVGVDRGVHLGSILLTTHSKGVADNAIAGMSRYLQQTFDWPEERAKKFAEMIVVYEGPNWAGFGFATGYAGLHHYNLRNK